MTVARVGEAIGDRLGRSVRACAFFGLVPIMWSSGTGADVMKRIAAPMIGGLFTSFLMELLVYPAVYLLWKWHSDVKKAGLVPEPTLATREAL